MSYKSKKSAELALELMEKYSKTRLAIVLAVMIVYLDFPISTWIRKSIDCYSDTRKIHLELIAEGFLDEQTEKINPN